MKTLTPRIILTLVCMMAAAAAWTIVILVALHVSQIVLETLDMIVELAAISP